MHDPRLRLLFRVFLLRLAQSPLSTQATAEHSVRFDRWRLVVLQLLLLLPLLHAATACRVMLPAIAGLGTVPLLLWLLILFAVHFLLSTPQLWPLSSSKPYSVRLVVSFLS